MELNGFILSALNLNVIQRDAFSRDIDCFALLCGVPFPDRSRLQLVSSCSPGLFLTRTPVPLRCILFLLGALRSADDRPPFENRKPKLNYQLNVARRHAFGR